MIRVSSIWFPDSGFQWWQRQGTRRYTRPLWDLRPSPSTPRSLPPLLGVSLSTSSRYPPPVTHFTPDKVVLTLCHLILALKYHGFRPLPGNLLHNILIIFKISGCQNKWQRALQEHLLGQGSQGAGNHTNCHSSSPVCPVRGKEENIHHLTGLFHAIVIAFLQVIAVEHYGWSVPGAGVWRYGTGVFYGVTGAIGLYSSFKTKSSR